MRFGPLAEGLGELLSYHEKFSLIEKFPSKTRFQRHNPGLFQKYLVVLEQAQKKCRFLVCFVSWERKIYKAAPAKQSFVLSILMNILRS
mgnify:CR=1 FL=1